MLVIPLNSIECYFLPEDGEIAESRFLELLRNPGETWISAYGFTLAPMFDEIEAADQRGTAVHCLLDHTQAAGPCEAGRLKTLALEMQHGDITITTAGCGSASTSQIWHTKAVVVGDPDGGEPYCWTGSVNFSESGWLQGNTAMVFRSQAWADMFIEQLTRHREWAQTHEPQFSKMLCQEESA